MNKPLLVLAVAFIAACSSPKSETAVDSTNVAPDTVSLQASVETGTSEETSSSESQSEEAVETGRLNDSGEYMIANQPSYITDPFAFALDSATIMDLLGEETTIESTQAPGGDDYEAYSFYRVKNGKTSLSFYSYSGKHFADIDTPLLPMRYDIVIGMAKAEFLEKMDLSGADAEGADVFTIDDDYGSLSFYFGEGKLVRVYVSYEEGD